MAPTIKPEKAILIKASSKSHLNMTSGPRRNLQTDHTTGSNTQMSVLQKATWPIAACRVVIAEGKSCRIHHGRSEPHPKLKE
jgi:hypothetical protein